MSEPAPSPAAPSEGEDPADPRPDEPAAAPAAAPPDEPADAPTPLPSRWTRRRFLKLGVAGGGLGILGGVRFGFHDVAAFEGLTNLSSTEGAILREIVSTVLPPEANRAPEKLADHVRFIDEYVTGLDPSDLFQLRWLLTLFEHSTILELKVRRFTRLQPADRIDVLAGWQTSSIGLRRLAYRSLKSLAFLAYYRDDEAFATIGYPGPLMRGFAGPREAQERYDPLLAPPAARPGGGS